MDSVKDSTQEAAPMPLFLQLPEKGGETHNPPTATRRGVFELVGNFPWELRNRIWLHAMARPRVFHMSNLVDYMFHEITIPDTSEVIAKSCTEAHRALTKLQKRQNRSWQKELNSIAEYLSISKWGFSSNGPSTCRATCICAVHPFKGLPDALSPRLRSKISNDEGFGQRICYVSHMEDFCEAYGIWGTDTSVLAYCDPDPVPDHSLLIQCPWLFEHVAILIDTVRGNSRALRDVARTCNCLVQQQPAVQTIILLFRASVARDEVRTGSRRAGILCKSDAQMAMEAIDGSRLNCFTDPLGFSNPHTGHSLQWMLPTWKALSDPAKSNITFLKYAGA
jgi:hypothetical protein